MPTISIVTITLNEENNLPALFASLRAQTDKDFDFIVMDGASKDGTIALLQGAGDLVTQCTSEPDFGFFDALNKAVRQVRTDYYLVLGADDALAPDAVANFKASAAAAVGDVDLVIAAVDADGRILRGYHPEKRWLGPSAMYTSHSVGTLIRTALHQRFGYYSFKYAIYGDGLFVKKVMIAPGTRVTEGDFVAGIFCTQGFSAADLVRSTCELWMMQRETGENRLLQFLLFQLRLLRNLRRVMQR